MNVPQHFLGGVQALGGLIQEFRKCCEGLAKPQLESELAAYTLMLCAARHVEAIRALAGSPTFDSHQLSAWPVARAAFEASLTACWLVQSDNIDECEARWLGWLAEDERTTKKFLKLLGEDSAFATFCTERLLTHDSYRDEAEQRITATAHKQRATIDNMLKDCGFPVSTYVLYAASSSMVHCGPAVYREIWMPSPYEGWNEVIKQAGWSLAEAGIRVLCRLGTAQDRLNQLNDRYGALLEHARRLDPK